MTLYNTYAISRDLLHKIIMSDIMYNIMRIVSSPGMSVSVAVREIITRNRSIHDCMKMDLINYTALAVKIQSEVEKMLENPVNLNTIVVAIKRYADSFVQGEEYTKDESVLKNARLALTSGMMDVRFPVKGFEQMDPVTMLDKFSKVVEEYEFFRMSDSFRFVAEDMEGVRRVINDIQGIQEEMFSTGLAKIRILMPKGHSRSDVVSYVAEVLHSAGIEIENAFFGQDSITIMLDEKDASRAYEILHLDITRV